MFVLTFLRLLLAMTKKLTLFLPLFALMTGCAFDLSLGSFRHEAPPAPEFAQVRADLAVAKENIRNLEEQHRATLAELEKARGEVAMLQQRLVDLASTLAKYDKNKNGIIDPDERAP
jgi:hypothetical protein